MDRQKQSILAVSALVVVVSAAFGLSFTGGEEEPASASKAELASFVGEADQKACASAATYGRLKKVLFEDALKVRSTDPENLSTLATHSVVRMENPVVKSRDAGLGVTTCSGTFILELPPGAERAFGGQRRLTAEIDYAARPAADGSGIVYQINGAETIMAQLADFNLNSQGYLPPQQPRIEFAEAAPLPDAPLGMGGPEEPVPPEEVDRAAAVERAEADPQTQSREREARAERTREKRRAERAEPTRRAEARPRRGNARPSFNCRYARTRSELMVCDNRRLAARDREMAAMFHSAMADADRRTRRELNRTRDRFLAYRDRCGSEDCVADAYVGRMREIEDIMIASE